MHNTSEQYLEKTLFQARKHGLNHRVIQQLETELNQRIQRNNTLK